MRKIVVIEPASSAFIAARNILAVGLHRLEVGIPSL